VRTVVECSAEGPAGLDTGLEGGEEAHVPEGVHERAGGAVVAADREDARVAEGLPPVDQDRLPAASAVRVDVVEDAGGGGDQQAVAEEGYARGDAAGPKHEEEETGFDGENFEHVFPNTTVVFVVINAFFGLRCVFEFIIWMTWNCHTIKNCYCVDFYFIA
jgi:hypothetical protein